MLSMEVQILNDYRESTLGRTLSESLNVLVAEEQLLQEEADVVMDRFNRRVNEELEKHPPVLMVMEGELEKKLNSRKTRHFALHVNNARIGFPGKDGPKKANRFYVGSKVVIKGEMKTQPKRRKMK